MRSTALRIIFLIATICGLCTYSHAQDNAEDLAVQYYQNAEYDKAAPLFESLYNSSPNPRIYSYYFDCLIQIKDYKKAERFVSKQVKRYPDDQRYAVDLGYIALLSGDESGSRKQFESVIKQVPPYRQGYIDLSNAFLLRGQTDYAIRVLQKGKKVVDYEIPLNFELADIFIKQGDFTQALGEYLELLDRSEQYLTEIESKLQDILSVDPDHSRNDQFKSELLARLKKNPDKTRYAELLLWYFIQQKDFDAAFIQARSLDKRLGEEGTRVFELGRLAVSNESYDAGIQCFEYLISQGERNPYWFSARIALMDARYLKITGSSHTQADITQLETEYKSALESLGKNPQTIVLMRNLAHLEAFYLQDVPAAKALLDEAIQMPNAKPADAAQCKMEMADILLMNGEVWDATLLYSQVEKAFKNDPLGAEAKFRNAKLSFYIGEFDWARAQLDVLKAATSKLIANDAMQLSLLISDNIEGDSNTTALRMYSRADLLEFMQKDDLALITLDSINSLGLYHPLFDEVLYKKGEIYLKEGNYQMADSLFKKVFDFYPNDILADDALFKLAGLQEKIFGNKEAAMNYYKEIYTNYPGSIYAVDARRQYRLLRGDQNP
jgi:tetratricopeptide (TPR) repeat protein